MSGDPNMFSLATRKALQVQLKTYGFYNGPLDGGFGKGTITAMRKAFGLAG